MVTKRPLGNVFFSIMDSTTSMPFEPSSCLADE
jgi:hypothetical protein